MLIFLLKRNLLYFVRNVQHVFTNAIINYNYTFLIYIFILNDDALELNFIADLECVVKKKKKR